MVAEGQGLRGTVPQVVSCLPLFRVGDSFLSGQGMAGSGALLSVLKALGLVPSVFKCVSCGCLS